MLVHLASLIARSILAIPSSLGSTWLGIAFPVLVAILSEFAGVCFFGWSKMIANWRKVTGVGFAGLGIAYTMLFIWCAAKTTYEDHSYLVEKAHEFRSKYVASEQSKSAEIMAVASAKDGDISILKQDCAKREGANDFMERQIKEQQNSINNCQNQALKLLQPAPLNYQTMVLDSITNDQQRSVNWLMVTNRIVNPVNLEISCSEEILGLTAGIVGQLTANRSSQYSTYLWTAQVSSPSWTPEAPLEVHTITKVSSEKTVKCEFKATGATR